MTLNYARAGHPEPILLRADGSAQALPARGSLLGIFPDEQYETRTLQLAAGDRLVLYTDGIEGVFGPGSDGGPPDLLNLFSSWARLSRPEVMLQINACLSAAPSRKRTADDVTVVIADIGRE
jgi:serine phosphatase RsbU (regulator of sigma subunit)